MSDISDGQGARRVLAPVQYPWLALAILPLAALCTKPFLPPWAFMWLLAGAIFFGCKWLTLCAALSRARDLFRLRSLAYLFLWPGMDPKRFLARPVLPVPQATTVFAAACRIVFGALLLFVLAREVTNPLLAGWIGMVGLILLLHFGLFDLLSAGWRYFGFDAKPIMDAPLRSTSVGEFWSRRWNGAFNQLAFRHVFRPLVRRIGVNVATLCAFLVSGLVHEVVISLPVNAGYGLPTAYFLLQGLALLVEHTGIGKRLLRGWRGWLLTMIIVAVPAPWLFHPPFVRGVIIPFMQVIHAL